MKKISYIITTCLLILSGLSLQAQSYFYLENKGTAAEYKYNTLGNVVFQSSTSPMPDTLSAWQVLPFPWSFHGQTVTGYFISDNGYITFDPAAKGSQPSNLSLPDTNAPRNAIFACWDALNVIRTSTSGDFLVHNWTLGAAPNRIHVIHWFNVHHETKLLDPDTRFFFGILIYESGPKKFDIVLDWKYNSTVTSTATIGVQNLAGDQGLMVTGSPAFTFPALGSDKTDDVVYEFYEGGQPAYDMSVISNTLPRFLKTNFSIPVTGTIRNMGSTIVNSYTLNYSVNGGTVVSQAITGVTILPGKTAAFSHPQNWVTPATEGVYNMTVWATNINGSPDGNTSNDSFAKDINIIDNSTQRLVLHEVFTSSTCGPCNGGNANLQDVFDALPDNWTCVKYQMDYPGTGDPYYTSECGDRSNFYGYINSIPRLLVDGGWNKNPSGYTENLLDSLYAIPSFFDITATYKVTDKRVDIDASITPLGNFNITSLKAFIAIVEKVTTQNVKSNGETEFNWVMKKMVPSANGVTLNAMTKNNPVPVVRYYTFKGNYTLAPDGQHPINLSTQNSVEEFTDLAVVIWIQDINTREVFQSAWASPFASINDQPEALQLLSWPNPVSDVLNLKFKLTDAGNTQVIVYDVFGREVYQSGLQYLQPGTFSLSIDASGFANGSYIAMVKSGNHCTSIKFIR